MLWGNYQKVLEHVSKPSVHGTMEKPLFFLEKYIENKVSHTL